MWSESTPSVTLIRMTPLNSAGPSPNGSGAQRFVPPTNHLGPVRSVLCNADSGDRSAADGRSPLGDISITKPVEGEADAYEDPTEINVRVVWELWTAADSQVIKPGVVDRHTMKACSSGEIEHFPLGPE